MAAIFFIILILVVLCSSYWIIMALASVRNPRPPAKRTPTNRFAIALPAHNEVDVIGETVSRLLKLDYPRELFAVHIVADHCSDQTAAVARAAGAQVHERNTGPRSGKGAALSWLFEQILTEDKTLDGVIIFDADTLVAPDFLQIMDAHLAAGKQVIQGQHVISNPDAGWFPALTWAMFLVDNRYQNLGRVNLGMSAKHMGDSICFRADVLRRFGWGEGLTEDYQLRQRLLLEGIHIYYEPSAKGLGEATLTWQQARNQRARWLKGATDAGKQFRGQLLREGIKRRDIAILDGALQAYIPSFSTLTLICGAMLVIKLLLRFVGDFDIPDGLIIAWIVMLVILFLYPLFGLALERAPLKAYPAILSGPVFIFWRTWLAFNARYGQKQVTWIRTTHVGQTKKD